MVDQQNSEDYILNKASDSEYEFRKLLRSDFELGFPDVLKGLTEVGQVTREQFEATFDAMFANQGLYRVVVVVDRITNKIIGSGTLMLEQKFIRQCGIAGHIEDIVVNENYRGKNLGLRLINILKDLGVLCRCYKVILDCSDDNVKFYEKCGFIVKGKQMALYTNKP